MSKKRILLVDDNDIDRELIRLKLHRVSEDYELIESDSAEEALGILESKEVDCILSDFQMPYIDGLQFLSMLRGKQISTPFIFLTGQGSEEVAAEALREGAEDYFTKEESFAHYERLVNSIARVIDNHQTLRQKRLMENERRNRALEMQALFDLSENIRSELSYGNVIKSAMEGILNAVGPDFVLIFSRSGDRLQLMESGPADSPFTHTATPEHHVGECLCGIAVQTGESVYSFNIHNDHRCTWAECKEAGLHSFAAFPLRNGKETFGVIGLASSQERDFQEQNTFLETIAAIISSAVSNALKFREVNKRAERLEASILQLSEIMENNTGLDDVVIGRIEEIVNLYRSEILESPDRGII